MIDTSEYSKKLELLAGYMDYFVTAKLQKYFYEDTKRVIDVFYETGYLINKGSKLRIISFEDYQSRCNK